MCRRTEEEVEPMVNGLPRHRHFVGFFNVPVQTPTRDPPFYGYSEKPPHFSRLLRHAWGYGGHILDLTPPRVPTGVFLLKLLLVGIKTAMHTKCRYADRQKINHWSGILNILDLLWGQLNMYTVLAYLFLLKIGNPMSAQITWNLVLRI